MNWKMEAIENKNGTHDVIISDSDKGIKTAIYGIHLESVLVLQRTNAGGRLGIGMECKYREKKRRKSGDKSGK